MVIVRSDTSATHRCAPVDPLRVSAWAFAISLNFVALVWLAQPIDLPLDSIKRVVPPDIQAIEIEPLRSTPLAIPEFPELPSRPVKPEAAVIAPPVAVAAELSRSVSEALSRSALQATQPVMATPSEGLWVEEAAANRGVAVLAAPKPDYPARQRRLQHEGTVVLLVDVASDGGVLGITIERSSGHGELDRAAMAVIRQGWRFQAAIDGGRTIASKVRVPVSFRLADRG